jgi:ABC-type maltose transport system permease subunit
MKRRKKIMTDTIIVNMLYIVSIMLAWILKQLGMHDVLVAVIIITLTCNMIMNIYWLWKESNSIDDDDGDD